MKYIDKEKEVIYDDAEEWFFFEVFLKWVIIIAFLPFYLIYWLFIKPRGVENNKKQTRKTVQRKSKRK